MVNPVARQPLEAADGHRGNDAVPAQASVDAASGDNSAPWIGSQGSGRNQPVFAPFIGAIVQAGYNINMTGPISAKGPTPAESAARLADVWPTPVAARNWVVDPLGENIATTYNTGRTDNIPGTRLLASRITRRMDLVNHRHYDGLLPDLVQSYIADALTRVLRDKGLTSSQMPGVVFALHWSAEDASCNNVDGLGGCIEGGPKDSPVIQAHVRLEARQADRDVPIWQADFRGFRQIPVNSPTRSEIDAIFIPAFSEALADYPSSN